MIGNDQNIIEFDQNRLDMLKNEYGHVQKGAENLEPNDVYVYFKTDDRPVNQGKCFYNYDQNIYYITARRSNRNESQETVLVTLERGNNDTRDEITFYVSGK